MIAEDGECGCVFHALIVPHSAELSTILGGLFYPPLANSRASEISPGPIFVDS